MPNCQRVSKGFASFRPLIKRNASKKSLMLLMRNTWFTLAVPCHWILSFYAQPWVYWSSWAMPFSWPILATVVSTWASQRGPCMPLSSTLTVFLIPWLKWHRTSQPCKLLWSQPVGSLPWLTSAPMNLSRETQMPRLLRGIFALKMSPSPMMASIRFWIIFPSLSIKEKPSPSSVLQVPENPLLSTCLCVFMSFNQVEFFLTVWIFAIIVRQSCVRTLVLSFRNPFSIMVQSNPILQCIRI